MAKEAARFVIMQSESVLQCTNGVSSNPAEGRKHVGIPSPHISDGL